MAIGKITLSGHRTSIGHRPVSLKLTAESIYIGKERIEIRDKKDIEIRVIGYKGQFIVQQKAFYQTHHGNDNLMRIRFGDKTTEFKFVLESESHKDKLLKFCEENGFRI